jgi:hypothetical protein
MLAGICPVACIALYCSGVICSKQGGSFIPWKKLTGCRILDVFKFYNKKLPFMSEFSLPGS